MNFWKLVGYRKFVQHTDNGDQNKIQVCFEDPYTVADVGHIYKSYSFRADKVPDFKKDDIGKELIVDIGSFNGAPYGKEIVFR